MIEPVNEEPRVVEPVTPPALRRGGWSVQTRCAMVFAFLAGTVSFGTIGRQYLGSSDTARNLVELLVPIAIPILISLFALRQEQRWARPLRKAELLIAKIRRGEVPIQELSNIRGGIEPLVPAIQDLLRELRERARDNAVMQSQIRQRVEHRTDALERTIGSLHKQARLDKLTGVFNRRALDDTLPHLFEQCRIGKMNLCVMMIDVDHFKLLNDTLGHDAGDLLLRDIAKIISTGLGSHDSAYRLGGDEFLLLLPGMNEKASTILADRLISLVDALARPLRVTRAPRLSIGVAHSTQSSSHADLLKRADVQLYEMKTQRRSARQKEVA